MPLTVIDVGPVLKQVNMPGWDKRALVNAHPLMTQIEQKNDVLAGENFKIPIAYAKPAGRSHTPATAVANRAGSKYKAFLVTPVSDFLSFSIDGAVVRKAENGGDKTQFVNSVKQEVEMAFQTCGDNLAKEAYGSSTGARGQVSATVAPSGTTLTLANPAQTAFFGAGMVIKGSATDGAAHAAGAVTIVAVDLSAGTLTGNGAWSTITSIGVNWFLYAEGDLNLAASGLESWNPATAPTSTLFNGVDRSVAPDFLGGMRYDGVASGDSLESVFISSDALTGLQVGNPFHDSEIYINPISMGSLRISKEGQRFVDSDNEYGIGVKKFRTTSGHVLVEDRDAPVGVARMIGKGGFFFCTVGDGPSLAADQGGGTMRYQDTTDTYTGAIPFDYNFASNPAALARIALPST
jgi:hypothetical protein